MTGWAVVEALGVGVAVLLLAWTFLLYVPLRWRPVGRYLWIPKLAAGAFAPFIAAAGLLRVRVLEGGRPTVKIKVPISVAKWGMKMAQAFSPQMKDADLDWDAITAIIQEGEQGKIVEVEDEVNHKTVEVWVE